MKNIKINGKISPVHGSEDLILLSIPLNVRAKTIKLLEENRRVSPHDLGFGKRILRHQKSKQLKKKKKKNLDVIRIKNFRSSRRGTVVNESD